VDVRKLLPSYSGGNRAGVTPDFPSLAALTMILNRHHYPMSEPPVKREGERASEPRAAVITELSAVTLAAEPQETRAAEPQLVYRLLNYKDIGEVRAFVTQMFAISAEADPSSVRRSLIDKLLSFEEYSLVSAG